MIPFDLGIPQLKKDGIQLGANSLDSVKGWNCTSMIDDWLWMRYCFVSVYSTEELVLMACVDW